MRILLTGATGFMGTRLRGELAHTGHEVVSVTRELPREAPGAHHQWIQMDLGSTPAFPSVAGIDTVVYLAQSRAYREFPARVREIFAVNVTALLGILEWARTAGVRSFIYASSANVYPASLTPLSEATPLAPDSFYGRSKQMGEMLVASYAPYFRCTAFRFFTVYGEGQSGMLVPTLIERVRKGQAIQLQGSAGLRLSPVHVGDATRFIKAALESEGAIKAEGVFNLGGPESLSLRQMGEVIGEALGQPPIFEHAGGPEPAGFVADSTKLAAAFGAFPTVTFRDGIRRTLGVP